MFLLKLFRDKRKSSQFLKKEVFKMGRKKMQRFLYEESSSALLKIDTLLEELRNNFIEAEKRGKKTREALREAENCEKMKISDNIDKQIKSLEGLKKVILSGDCEEITFSKKKKAQHKRFSK